MSRSDLEFDDESRDVFIDDDEFDEDLANILFKKRKEQKAPKAQPKDDESPEIRVEIEERVDFGKFSPFDGLWVLDGGQSPYNELNIDTQVFPAVVVFSSSAEEKEPRSFDVEITGKMTLTSVESQKTQFFKVTKVKAPAKKTSYSIFCSEKKKELLKGNPKLSKGELNDRCKSYWSKLTPAQQSAFYSKATNLKAEQKEKAASPQFKVGRGGKMVDARGILLMSPDKKSIEVMGDIFTQLFDVSADEKIIFKRPQFRREQREEERLEKKGELKFLGEKIPSRAPILWDDDLQTQKAGESNRGGFVIGAYVSFSGGAGKIVRFNDRGIWAQRGDEAIFVSYDDQKLKLEETPPSKGDGAVKKIRKENRELFDEAPEFEAILKSSVTPKLREIVIDLYVAHFEYLSFVTEKNIEYLEMSLSTDDKKKKRWEEWNKLSDDDKKKQFQGEWNNLSTTDKKKYTGVSGEGKELLPRNKIVVDIRDFERSVFLTKKSDTTSYLTDVLKPYLFLRLPEAKFFRAKLKSGAFEFSALAQATYGHYIPEVMMPAVSGDISFDHVLDIIDDDLKYLVLSVAASYYSILYPAAKKISIPAQVKESLKKYAIDPRAVCKISEFVSLDELTVCFDEETRQFTCHSVEEIVRSLKMGDSINEHLGKKFPRAFVKKMVQRYGDVHGGFDGKGRDGEGVEEKVEKKVEKKVMPRELVVARVRDNIGDVLKESFKIRISKAHGGENLSDENLESEYDINVTEIINGTFEETIGAILPLRLLNTHYGLNLDVKNSDDIDVVRDAIYFYYRSMTGDDEAASKNLFDAIYSRGTRKGGDERIATEKRTIRTATEKIVFVKASKIFLVGEVFDKYFGVAEDEGEKRDQHGAVIKKGKPRKEVITIGDDTKITLYRGTHPSSHKESTIVIIGFDTFDVDDTIPAGVEIERGKVQKGKKLYLLGIGKTAPSSLEMSAIKRDLRDLYERASVLFTVGDSKKHVISAIASIIVDSGEGKLVKGETVEIDVGGEKEVAKSEKQRKGLQSMTGWELPERVVVEKKKAPKKKVGKKVKESSGKKKDTKK